MSELNVALKSEVIVSTKFLLDRAREYASKQSTIEPVIFKVAHDTIWEILEEAAKDQRNVLPKDDYQV